GAVERIARAERRDGEDAPALDDPPRSESERAQAAAGVSGATSPASDDRGALEPHPARLDSGVERAERSTSRGSAATTSRSKARAPARLGSSPKSARPAKKARKASKASKAARTAGSRRHSPPAPIIGANGAPLLD
ncbi:MAG TPA: hypothetical protein VMG12_08375, partial [Polyangiaceae bacterium]|nr:hypothetical protein [Polyangiaceae bacterium]